MPARGDAEGRPRGAAPPPFSRPRHRRLLRAGRSSRAPSGTSKPRRNSATGSTRPPARWRLSSTSQPSPVATRSAPAARATRPAARVGGAALRVRGEDAQLLGAELEQRAPGRGASARTRRASSAAGSSGSSRASSGPSFGAKLARAASCGAQRAPPLAISVERLRDRVRGERGEPLLEAARGFVGADRRALHETHRARVHLALDAHHRDARLRVAGEDRVRDRRGAAVARQQARVRVDAVAEPRQLADRLRQELPERHDHAEVGRQLAQRGDDARRPRRARAAAAGRRRASARSATGDGESFRPRPRGRSGWLTTPATRCGPASSRSSVGTAQLRRAEERQREGRAGAVRAPARSSRPRRSSRSSAFLRFCT